MLLSTMDMATFLTGDRRQCELAIEAMQRTLASKTAEAEQLKARATEQELDIATLKQAIKQLKARMK